MTRNEFIDGLKNALETDFAISEETDISTLPEYSSLSVLAIIIYLDDRLGKTFSADELSQAVVVSDLISLIGEETIENSN
ncbi:hypothetical protein N8737_05070 [Verrucomicrobia bacterium]|nr:hypothetical protein [Verrucomicrobiota bacterium]MDA7658048.1 hypothetical protein [Verrucomicrobiota bacterium]